MDFDNVDYIVEFTKLVDAGFTGEEIKLCEQRYKECNLNVSYPDWCRAYIALNSTKEVEDGGIMLDGAMIAKALVIDARKGNIKELKKPIFKVSKNKFKA